MPSYPSEAMTFHFPERDTITVQLLRIDYSYDELLVFSLTIASCLLPLPYPQTFQQYNL